MTEQTKELAPMLDATIQSRVREEAGTGLALVLWIAGANEIISPWWSTYRDVQLRRFWKQVDFLSGAVYTLSSRMTTIPFRILPKDMTIEAHKKQAEKFQILLEEDSEFGDGWTNFFSKWNEDLTTQDNGAFGEIIGEGDPLGPIQGMPLGLANLDASKCTRTSNPEFPVIYQNVTGERFKLHHTRVMFSSLQPSTTEEMYNVGFCSVSRCINIAQNLLDILVYEQEKLGSRPHRNVMVTQGGLDPDIVKSAFALAEETMDNQRLTRYSKTVVIGSSAHENAALQMVDMNTLPDHFDKQTSITIGMATIALAFGVDARELFPMMGIGATRADALVQHLKARGKGIGHLLQIAETKINQKVLPPTLKIVFDFQDDAQDKQVADIKMVRTERHAIDIKNEMVDMRTVHEQMLADGDITDAQFERMELENGRLVDGTSVLTLFFSPEHKKILNMGIPDPLNVEINDPNDMLVIIEETKRDLLEGLGVIANHRNRKLMTEGLAALDALKSEYEATRPPPIPVEGEELEEPEGDIETVDEGEAEVEMEEVGETESPFEEKSIDFYGRQVRGFTRALWAGTIDVLSFSNNMMQAISRGYERAWQEGAATCGITPEERSVEEEVRLRQERDSDVGRVMSFADYIEQNNKASGQKLSRSLARARIWTNRYSAIVSIAQQISCADKKFKWILGPTEEHCSDCLNYAGRVHRGTVWRTVGAQPQSRSLECGGWNCLCAFSPTNDRASGGRPPRPRGG